MIGLAVYVAAALAPAAEARGLRRKILSMPWAKMYNVAISEEMIEQLWGGAQRTVVRDAELANPAPRQGIEGYGELAQGALAAL